jgi:hypothetical protein
MPIMPCLVYPTGSNGSFAQVKLGEINVGEAVVAAGWADAQAGAERKDGTQHP